VTELEPRMVLATRPTRSRQVVAPDLLCFSHLRWDFVYQRPQHLHSRFGRGRRVFFIEEPVFGEGAARLELRRPSPSAAKPSGPDYGHGHGPGVRVAVPHLPRGLDPEQAERTQRALLDGLLRRQNITDYIAWYSSPMLLGRPPKVAPLVTVYDCMDELSGFLGAPASLREREAELLGRADLVFTGGRSLYLAKRDRHASVHLFPSSIDVDHFGQARTDLPEPADQARIQAGVQVGYFGVIDERLDRSLLAAIADARPDWSIIMVGPVVKIAPESLPQRPNIHYLGGKSYDQLPAYIAHWEVALLPFARNDATRFISPTKIPEYLAAGCPVVSTSIADVIEPYGRRGLVAIADEPEDFVAKIAAELDRPDRPQWQAAVDELLAQNSWDATWARMNALVDTATRRRIAQCSTL
jgi:hypothetical protein